MSELIEGADVRLRGRLFVIPALSFRAIKKHRKSLKTLMSNADSEDLPSDEEFEMICDVVHAAIERNYPELSRSDMDELLDLKNARGAVMACLGASNLMGGSPQMGKPESASPSTTSTSPMPD